MKLGYKLETSVFATELNIEMLKCVLADNLIGDSAAQSVPP